MALGDRGGALEDSVSDSNEEDDSTSTTAGDTGSSGHQDRLSHSDPTDTSGSSSTSDRDRDDDNDDHDTAFRGRTGETSGTSGSDDDDDTSPVEDTFSGGDMNQSGDPSQQTSDTGQSGLEGTPADKTKERTDRTHQTGPTGPTADEGLEQTGDPMPEPEGDIFDPTAESSPGGSSVSQSEIRSALERGKTITNIEDKPAVASQIEGLGGSDIREKDIGPATDVDLGPGGFTVRRSERGIAKQAEEQVTEQTEYTAKEIAITGSREEGFDPVLTKGAQQKKRAKAAEIRAEALEGPPEEVQRGFQSEEEILRNTVAAPSQEVKSQLEQQAERQATKAQLQAYGMDPSNVGGLKDGETVDLERGKDYVIERVGGRQYRARLTEEFEKDLQSAAMQTATIESKARPEQFGDIDWSMGLGGPGDEVERTIDTTAEKIQKRGQQAGREIFKPSGVAGQSAGQEILEAAGREQLGKQYEQGLRSVGKGLVGGTTAIVNVPGVAGGLMEGVEYSKYTTEETAAGRGGGVAGQTFSKGKQIYDRTKENPWRTTGLLVGSLGASTGIMGAASKVSRRAGVASRFAIQPGEELAGYGGYYATKTASSAKTAQRLFPNKEPLIFSEEFAIRQASRAGRKLKGTTADINKPSVRRPAIETPISIESDPNAGLVEVSGDIKRSLRESTIGRAESGVETIRQTPSRAKYRAESMADTLTDVTVDPKSRLKAEAGRMQEGTLKTIDEGQQRIQSAIETGGQKLTKAELQAGEVKRQAQSGIQSRVQQVREFEPQAIGQAAKQRARSAYEVGGQKLTKTELQVGEFGRRTKQRTAEGLTTISELPSDTQATLTSRLETTRSGLRSAYETGGQRYTRGLIRAEEATFQAKQQAKQRIESAITLPGRARGKIESSVGEKSDYFKSAYETKSQQATKLQLQALDLGFRTKQRLRGGEGIGFDTPNIRQAARREATALRFELAEQKAGVKRKTAELQDLSIKIGDVESETIFETEAEGQAPISSAFDNPLDIEGEIESVTETETSDRTTSDVGKTVETEVSGGSGVAVQRIRVETEAEQKTGRAESAQESEVANEIPKLEITTGEQDAQAQQPQVDTFGRQQPTAAQGMRPRSDTGAEIEQVRTELEVGADTEAHLGADFELGTELAAETELGLELRRPREIEAETERPEQRFEIEGEPESRGDDMMEDMQRSSMTFAGGTSKADPFYSSGWYNELVTAIAVGAGPRKAPSQSQLEDVSESADLTGQRPTKTMLTGTEQEKQQIEAAESFLSFGGFGDTNGGDLV